ncbi:large ribosomal subunit protein uL1-like [Macrobrachium nipponense]|uniref:large ribosomal subunit protein uL1-like n=1 Tax=Macrobrachium nipponense TaxID=159736 RepID=UPI0030C87DEA
MAPNILGTMAQVLTKPIPLVSMGNPVFFHTAAILEAARKGTRAKREAKKRASKKEVVKKEYIPYKKRMELLMGGGKSPRRYEEHLKYPTDDVWIARYWRRKMYSLRETIAMHRETHHETQYNVPDACVNVYMELYLNLDKKNRYMDPIAEVVNLPHTFDSGQQRNLLVISRKQEVIDYARQAGAALAIGPEIIKMAQKDEVNLQEFNYVVSEADILPELVAIRGLMKRQFPNTRNGTAGSDLIPIIDRFLHGVEYKSTKDKYHQDFGTIEVPFGRLSMTDEQLEDNFACLLKAIDSKKPKQRKSTDLLSLVLIRSPPSKEHFKINHELYIEGSAVEAEVAVQ